MNPIWSHSQSIQGDDHFNDHHISPELIEMIEEALGSLGEYGEVRLIVVKSRLRYVVTQRSIDVLKWQPGSFDKNIGG